MQNGVKTTPLQAFTKNSSQVRVSVQHEGYQKTGRGNPGTPQQKPKTYPENTRDLSVCEDAKAGDAQRGGSHLF